MEEKITFEQAYRRLEEVSELLEQDVKDLNESLKLYEEGISLYRICNEYLNDAKIRINKVNEDESLEEFKF